MFIYYILHITYYILHVFMGDFEEENAGSVVELWNGIYFGSEH